MTTTRHKGRPDLSCYPNSTLPRPPFAESTIWAQPIGADYVAEGELRQPASRLACPFRGCQKEQRRGTLPFGRHPPARCSLWRGDRQIDKMKKTLVLKDM